MTWLGRLVWRHVVFPEGSQLVAQFDGYDWTWRISDEIVAWCKESGIRVRLDWWHGVHPRQGGITTWPILRFYRAKDVVMFTLRWL